METGKESGISRREFARRAAFISAASAFAPSNLLDARPPQPPVPTSAQAAASKLPAASQAEVESRVQAILAQYGSRLSTAQKADIRRLATEAQSTLDRLRAYPTENGDGPALYLHPLNERPRKPAASAPKPPQTSGSKKP